LVATALFGGVLGLVGPASAGSFDSGDAGTAVVADSAARALPKRNLNDKLVQKPRGLFMKGNVDPGYGKKPIVLLRAKCKTCAFKRYSQTRTDKEGKFSFRLGAPAKGAWFWKAFAKKQGNYGKSWSNFIYKTYRI
jgi:hypothetical protein